MLAMDDPKAIRLFEELIRDIARQEISKAKYNRMSVAVVVSADNVAKTATVKLLDDTEEIPNIKNRSGEDLAPGDECQVLFINSSLSNFVITIKN